MAAKRFNLNIDGAADLSERLRVLPGDVQREVLTPAFREGMTWIRDEAQFYAHMIDRPETRPYIAANIVLQQRVNLGKQLQAIIFQVGIKRKGEGLNTYYWWWQEFGTENFPAQSFMRRAFRENVMKVIKTTISAARYNMYRLGKGF